jgi:hypothetical protein
LIFTSIFTPTLKYTSYNEKDAKRKRRKTKMMRRKENENDDEK